MEDYRDEILDYIKNEPGGFPDTEDGTSFYDRTIFITDLVSNRDWFEGEG